MEEGVAVVVEVAVVETDDLIEIPLVGIGFRGPIADWVFSNPAEIDCVEITAEHFFESSEEQLAKLSHLYPVSVHGLGLSLGTPGSLDSQVLSQFQRVADSVDAKWISEHIAFTRTGDVDLGHLNPLPMTRKCLSTLVDHASELMDRCQRPLLLENITSYLRIPGDYSEPEFLNRLCEQAGTGLLLDVTNLFINSRNHDFDPIEWLHEVDSQHIRQIHIVGYSFHEGVWHDRHREPIQDDLFDLVRDVVAYAPVEAIILERDGAFPPVNQLAAELTRLEETCESAR